MGAALAIAAAPAKAGVIAAAVLAAAAVLVPAPRPRALAMAGALALTPALLVAHIWDSPQFQPFRERPLIALAAAGIGVVLLGAAALLIDRRPGVLPVAVLVALPFRIPIESGGTSSNLLLPLYVAIGAGALAFIVPRLRGRERTAGPRPGIVEWLLVGFVVLYAVQSLYGEGFGKALEQVVFFYVPFALLFALLVRVEWSPKRLRTCLGVLLGMALVFCAVGFVEYYLRELLLNPQVIASNQFQSYFRVNSLFFDPNIFGRFLVTVMLLVSAAMLWAARGRTVALSGAALAVLWGGLVLTLSQSSLGALLAGLAVLAALRWSARWTVAAVLAALALGTIVVAAFPQTLRLELDNQESIEKATSGRAKLVAGGGRLFAQRPVGGWGAGSFEPVYKREERVSGARSITASHTIPLTIAAEQGAIGAAVYLALLAAAAWRLLRRSRGSPARAGIAAAFVALVLHTWVYAAFLEDPLTWTLLAVGTVLAWGDRPEPELHPAEELRAQQPEAGRLRPSTERDGSSE